MVAKDGKSKKKSADHPTYEVMIITAIQQLKNRKGSSKQAILKYITANNKLSGSPNVHCKVALRKLIANGKVEVVSGKGLSGRFKLKASAVVKKPKKSQKPKKKPAQAAAKKPAAKPKSKQSKKPAKKSPKKSTKKPKSPKKTKKSPQKKQTAKKSTMKKQRKSPKKGKKSSPQKKKK